MASVPVVREPIVAREDERREIVSYERSLTLQQAGRPCLIGADGHKMILPEPLYQILVEAARQLGEGNGVAILPYSHELTTQQAAEVLNVSRPHVVTLLEGGEVPFHKAGTHRRVYLKDLLAYKRRRDASRRKALQSMVDEAQEAGIYDEQARVAYSALLDANVLHLAGLPREALMVEEARISAMVVESYYRASFGGHPPAAADSSELASLLTSVGAGRRR